MPIKISNATSQREKWLYCWREGDKWLREKEPGSIHENLYGTMVFAEIFEGYLRRLYPFNPAVGISGVRTEESPARHWGLTRAATYKGETWGRVGDKERGHYAMYPIYDWRLSDVWKAIHDNGWDYCKVYDEYYRYGIPAPKMRVSSLHHETAVKSLFHAQEIEPETWNRLSVRVAGVNTASQMQGDFLVPKKVPPMFESWKEYRDFLLPRLITNRDRQERMRRMFRQVEALYEEPVHEDWHKTGVLMIVTNDHFNQRRGTFEAAHSKHRRNRGETFGPRNT